MTMTLADAASLDDGVVTPRADQPKRRMFTAEYKARTLEEYDAADRGERGAILRADARAFGETFFTYYNHEHRHSEIGLHRVIFSAMSSPRR